MEQSSERWGSADADDFWMPTLAQRLEAKRKADQKAFAIGWSRIFYAIALALALATAALLTFR